MGSRITSSEMTKYGTKTMSKRRVVLLLIAVLAIAGFTRGGVALKSSGEEVMTVQDLFGTDDPSDDAAQIQGLADILLPDILTVDLSQETGFLNGRGLEDDVIDAELGLITEGLITTDCVDNDSVFLDEFPYLGVPNADVDDDDDDDDEGDDDEGDDEDDEEDDEDDDDDD